MSRKGPQNNIYDATSGKVRRQMVLDYKKVINENIRGVKVDKKSREVEIDLDQLDCPLDDILIKPGVFSSADEVLGSQINNILQIPIKDRSEIDPPLPDSDLLKVLHYYTSQRSETQDWKLKRAFDGSALLGLGFLVEKWAQDIIDEKTAKLFVERYEDNKNDIDVDIAGDDPEAGQESEPNNALEDTPQQHESDLEELHLSDESDDPLQE